MKPNRRTEPGCLFVDAAGSLVVLEEQVSSESGILADLVVGGVFDVPEVVEISPVTDFGRFRCTELVPEVLAGTMADFQFGVERTAVIGVLTEIRRLKRDRIEEEHLGAAVEIALL